MVSTIIIVNLFTDHCYIHLSRTNNFPFFTYRVHIFITYLIRKSRSQHRTKTRYSVKNVYFPLYPTA